MCSTDFSGLILFHYPYRRLRWRLRKPQAHKNWLRYLAKSTPITRIDYYFVPLREICRLHARFASDTPTDVITFELSLTPLWAEVYISPEVVKHNSQIYCTTFPEEMRRTLVHSLLHLLGYQDDTPAHRETMRHAENYALSLWKMFHVEQTTYVL